jgi:four helix bundle protein
MNDPEVTMPRRHANINLIAHEKALEAAEDAIKLVMRVPAPLKPIADQVIRSASSVAANLAEGHGRTGRDRLHFWRIAYASAKEAGWTFILTFQLRRIPSSYSVVGRVGGNSKFKIHNS